MTDRPPPPDPGEKLSEAGVAFGFGKLIGDVEFAVLHNKELHDTEPEKIRAFFKKYVVEWKPEIYEPFVEPRVRVTLSGEYPRWAKASARTYEMILKQPDVVGDRADRTAVGKDLAPKVAEKMGNYPELGKAAARAISGARLVELENVAHIPHLEATERFNGELVKFLKDD